MPIKPPRLRRGDIVGVASPASPPRTPGVIDDCVSAVRRLGFEPRLGSHAGDRHGFLAGGDEARVDDLHQLFADPGIKAVFCVRGGYGSGRLLGLIDYDLIGRNPKPFIGYSDLTCLQLAILKEANVVSFHGPTIDVALVSGDAESEVSQRLVAAVCGEERFVAIDVDESNRESMTIVGGTAEGWLCGGNLAIICSMIGTPWMPSLEGAILFLEDVGEPPFRIDRCLTHLRNAGLLKGVAGVALGAFSRCKDPLAGTEWRQSVADVLRERLDSPGVPVLSGLRFGHVAMNATIPIGIRARLDADAGELRFLESAVC